MEKKGSSQCRRTNTETNAQKKGNVQETSQLSVTEDRQNKKKQHVGQEEEKKREKKEKKAYAWREKKTQNKPGNSP